MGGLVTEQTNLAAALVAAQAAMPAVDKDGVNPHFKSKFTTLDSLVAATRPKLNEHGLAINQFPAVSDLGQPILITRITHVSGESLEYAMPLMLGEERQNMQALGAAITYARRFAWAAALGISSETDDDGEAARPAEKPKQRPKPKAEEDGDRLISDAQRARLFAIANEVAVSKEQVADIVRAVTGEPSTKTIRMSQYDEIVRQLQELDVPF